MPPRTESQLGGSLKRIFRGRSAAAPLEASGGVNCSTWKAGGLPVSKVQLTGTASGPESLPRSTVVAMFTRKRDENASLRVGVTVTVGTGSSE